MPPRDYDHNTVKIAIQKDRWKITHEPYRLKLVKGSFQLSVPLPLTQRLEIMKFIFFISLKGEAHTLFFW